MKIIYICHGNDHFKEKNLCDGTGIKENKLSIMDTNTLDINPDTKPKYRVDISQRRAVSHISERYDIIAQICCPYFVWINDSETNPRLILQSWMNVASMLKENGIFIFSPPPAGYTQLFRMFDIQHGKRSFTAKTKTRQVLDLLGSYIENHSNIDLIHVPNYQDHPKIKQFEEQYLARGNNQQFEKLYPNVQYCVFQKQKQKQNKQAMLQSFVSKLFGFT